MLFKKLCINPSVPSPIILIKRSHREREIRRHIGQILPDLRSIRPQGLYIFRDFIEARGGERIFIEDAVATRFHVPIRSGLVSSDLRTELFQIFSFEK